MTWQWGVIALVVSLTVGVLYGRARNARVRRHFRAENRKATAGILIDQLRMMCDDSDEMKYGTISTATLREYLDRIEPLL